MTDHLIVGQEGEAVAVDYLRRHGYRILEQNVRCGRDEIDIVACDIERAMVVFVEVKTRTSASPQYPVWTAVDARKRLCMRRAVAYWTTLHEYDGPGRTDVVCVEHGRVTKHMLNLGSDFF